MMSVQMAALDTSSGAFVTSDYYEPVTDADELERLRAQVAQLEYKLAAIGGDSAALESSDVTILGRGTWLVGLMVFQSLSSFILKRFESMLAQHHNVIFFLTMLVGAGGNAGGQSVVLVVRAIALGQPIPVWHQCFVGLMLACLVTMVGFARLLMQGVQVVTATALCLSLFTIVFSSVMIGTGLPFGLKAIGVDPAHASAAIQVTMDIFGIILTCFCCELVFTVIE